MSAPEKKTSGTTSYGMALGFVVMMAVITFGYFALGMPGMDHGGSGRSDGMPGMVMALDVNDFAQRNATDDAFVVNVQVPVAGSIAGTDAVIPYHELIGNDGFPTQLDTPISLYCETGRMSKIAADVLMRSGYTNVVYLAGGTDAWVQAGRTLA